MAAGYSFNSVCYATVEAAVDAYFTGVPPTISQSSPPVYLTTLERVSAGNWGAYVWDISNGQNFVSYSPLGPPFFPVCETYDTPDAFGDGMLLGWGVVAAIALAWAFTAMRKGL